MGLSRYSSRRARFTWRGRSVNRSAPQTSQKVIADCKDQRKLGGKCAYFSICTALEAHKRLQTDQPCPCLSWKDLEDKVMVLKEADGVGKMNKCFVVLIHTGVCYQGSEDTVKIKGFESINTQSQNAIDQAVRRYMKEGPMVGTFEVYRADLDVYSQSENCDEIYIAYGNPRLAKWTHAVAITGFGIQGIYPFWEFQNSYGPKWRGAARGFGQIYAIHLICLYGFTLA